jgi:hypothetical protein
VSAEPVSLADQLVTRVARLSLAPVLMIPASALALHFYRQAHQPAPWWRRWWEAWR